MGQEESTPSAAYGPPATLQERSLEAVAEHIKSGKARRIVVMTGAGISTAAGIPDFRSPKTGLYSNLARLKLPYAEAVFDIAYFRNRPEPFYVLAQELYPGKFHPTISHAFIALLAEKGLLQMLFTQNIDCLERTAGVPADKIVEAHGSFATQRCIECQVEFPDADMKAHVHRGEVPRCKECNGLVKPDITFFGEALPRAFSEKSHHTAMADLVLIIGTSLTVYPFASLPEMARKETPRVLFNMEKVGSLGSRADDVLELGACDDGIRKLAGLLGWTTELNDYWRNLVGDEEADRQLRSWTVRDEEIEDELQKLTGDIETVLKLEKEEDEEEKSDPTPEDNPSSGSSPETVTQNVHETTGAGGKESAESEKKDEEKPQQT
ncbi:NAD-dependent deacetylase sirtuin-2 [Trichoderma citrinoviride]|uniref:NAD-dependent protein deacetylase n=1 Tax=Trichoderma citrinoviride TaxID=58853 RepID=A0A2T4B5T4_9HYPO|nr:NAD-dependent deacetylase sirtuin-2 [Trichoderma citrinoviride]PTB64685.1 NAD-dependent deacetylase sirtuin-2 [Trichoderma citrinoviride]